MALTKILEPDNLHPAYNDVTVIYDSDNKNITGFNYVIDLFRIVGAGQRERIIRRRVSPRAGDGYGVFEISRILQNYLTLNEPFNPNNYSPTDSYIRWEMDIYEEYVTNEYINTNLGGDGINVAINVAESEGIFNVGDFIRLDTTLDSPLMTYFDNNVYSVISVTSSLGSSVIFVNILVSDLYTDTEFLNYMTTNGATFSNNTWSNTAGLLSVQPIFGFNIEPIEDSLVTVENKTAYNGSEPLSLFNVKQFNPVFPDSLTFNPQTDYFLPKFYNPIKYSLMVSNLDFNFEESNIENIYPAGYAITTLRPVQEVTNDYFNIEYNNQVKIRRGQSIGLNWYNNFDTSNQFLFMRTYDSSGNEIETRRKTIQTNLFPIMRTNVGYWIGANSEFVSGTDSDSGNPIDGVLFMENEDIEFYSIWIQGVDGEGNPFIKSQPYIFYLDREEFDYEEYQVYFLDRLGSVQSFTFVNKHKISFKVNREQSGQVIGRLYPDQGNNTKTFWGRNDNDSSKRMFNINQEESLELTTAWLNDEDSRRFEELLSSPIHYIRKVESNESYEEYITNKIVPYTLTTTSYDRKRLFQDDNNEYTIKLTKDNNEIINW